MDITLTTWLAIPAIGGVIGYLTNRLAVKMIFRPIKQKNILGFKVQGLMPRRQPEMAKSIGAVVGDHLLRHDDLIKGLASVDFEAVLSEVLDIGLGPKIDELRNLPLIGGFLTDDRIADLRASLIKGIVSQKALVMEKFEEALEQGLDVRALVTEKVAAFPVEKLESLVLQIAARELRAIELLGGVLGVIIGVGQVALLYLLG
jgi:uncharacterized membrane protein YheB (UPF0754 family)